MLLTGMEGAFSQVETHYLNSGEATKLINKPICSMGVIKQMPSFDLMQLEKEDAERDSTSVFFVLARLLMLIIHLLTDNGKMLTGDVCGQ